MKNLIITLACVLAFVGGAVAQEAVTLTTPQTITVSAKHVGTVCESFDNSTIVAEVHNGAHAVIAVKTYDATTTPTGATLLHQINIGNFSVNSLLKAVYNRLIADGVIEAGSVTGTPQ
jgi:TRAP-type mannitol/chloroaromatic compound transport system permease large subunit